jgi:hypothetical protein
MADQRKPYAVTINGLEHTLLLSAEDAARYGEAAVEVKESPKPANKARTADNK